MRIPWRILAIVLLPGGFVAGGIALAMYLRRRWLAREAAQVDALIASNRATSRKGFDVHDDALRQKTEQRRDVAERMRRRAAHVESGAAAAEVVRLKEAKR